MKNILLTGGKGFIGRNIRENCGNQYNIFSPDRQELELKETKSVTGYFKKLNPDVVVNTANVGGKRNTLSSEESCFYENLIAFKNKFLL